MKRCSTEELISRAKTARLIPADFSIENLEASLSITHSAAEAIAGVLRLDEDAMFSLLAIEHGFDSLPHSLLSTMEIPIVYRDDTRISCFRREGYVPIHLGAGGKVLVAVLYPCVPDLDQAIIEDLGENIELVFCNDRAFAAIFTSSMLDENNDFEETEFNTDEGHFLGSESEEEMFPGLYGGGSADLLYSEENTNQGDGNSEVHKTSGHVEDLGFLDMIQMMTQSRKTGSIYVASELFGDVYLFFDQGQIVHCITEFGNGEEGFYRIVGVQTGKFEIVIGPVDVVQTINTSTDGLILEGLRRIDESNA